MKRPRWSLRGQTQAPDPERRKLVINERVKITATLLNNSAVGAFAAGVLGPTAADLYGVSTPTTPYWWLFGTCWFCLAGILHLVAREVLGDLKP